MQVLVAYALDHEMDISARLADVARHYEPLWQVPVSRQGRDAGRVGLHVWDSSDSRWRWPTWQEDPTMATATLYLPLGYERLVGQVPAEEAALPLARLLLGRPDRVAELTGTFVIGTLDSEARRVTLMTDALGLGRLYELRFLDG